MSERAPDYVRVEPSRGGRMRQGARIEAFIAASDLERARAFYEDTIGLTFLEDNGFALVFEGGGTTLRVTAVEEVVVAGYTVLGWVVPDIEAATDDLRARGVAFADFAGLDQDGHGIWSAPGGARVAWFHDPDGNLLSLSQDR